MTDPTMMPTPKPLLSAIFRHGPVNQRNLNCYLLKFNFKYYVQPSFVIHQTFDLHGAVDWEKNK